GAECGCRMGSVRGSPRRTYRGGNLRREMTLESNARFRHDRWSKDVAKPHRPSYDHNSGPSLTFARETDSSPGWWWPGMRHLSGPSVAARRSHAAHAKSLMETTSFPLR